MPEPSSSNRREFAKSLVILAAAPIACTNSVAEQSADSHAAVTDALAEIVRARYGKFLTPEQTVSVKRGIARNLRMAEIVKQVKLSSSDEPGVGFRANLP